MDPKIKGAAWAALGMFLMCLAAPVMALYFVSFMLMELFYWPHKYAIGKMKEARVEMGLKETAKPMAKDRAAAKKDELAVLRQRIIDNDSKANAVKNFTAQGRTLKAPFIPGDIVKHVPYHAEGNAEHEDCENGLVTSVSATGIVFVRFKGVTSQGCNIDQLKLVRTADSVAPPAA